MNDYALRIDKIVNGYIVEFWEGDDDYPIKQQVVFEEQDTEKGEIECMKDLLLYIKEYFGVYYQKHSKHNLAIMIEGLEDET